MTVFLLAGCQNAVAPSRTRPIDSSPAYTAEEAEEAPIVSARREAFRVGVMLPLTGSAAKFGQGLRNAAMMAAADIGNPDLLLQFYDTKSMPGGARVAAENALRDKVRLVVGPLMGSSVQAVEGRMRGEGVPLVAFSTAEDVLAPGVYTLGLLVDEQVGRMISYAAASGRSRFALVLPDNPTGIGIAKSAARAAAASGAAIARIAFYPPDTFDFSHALKDFSGYKTPGGPGFDAVLVPESGAKLKSALAMLGYYDVSAPKVRFLGTSVWETTPLAGEAMAEGAWFPVLSRSYGSYFIKKYQELYGESPNSIYSLGYDAVALANAVAKKAAPSGFYGHNFDDTITSPDGYRGINGAFRIYPDGSNRRSLDIVEIRKGEDVVVDKGEASFGEKAAKGFPVPAAYPKIYGKDSALVLRQIYGVSQ